MQFEDLELANSGSIPIDGRNSPSAPRPVANTSSNCKHGLSSRPSLRQASVTSASILTDLINTSNNHRPDR